MRHSLALRVVNVHLAGCTNDLPLPELSVHGRGTGRAKSLRTFVAAAGFRFFSDAYFSTQKDPRQTIGCTYILYGKGAHMPGTILTYSEERRRKRRRSTYSTCAASERCKRRKFLPRLRRGCGNDFCECLPPQKMPPSIDFAVCVVHRSKSCINHQKKVHERADVHTTRHPQHN